MSNENNIIEIQKLDSNDITTKLDKIFKTIDKLNLNIDLIQKKNLEINKVYMRFEFNKTLSLNKTNSFLKFQVDLLNTEKKYYKNIKEKLLNKLTSEINEIAEYSLLILMSLRDLNIENKDAIKDLIGKVEKINKLGNNADVNKILSLINATIKNIKILYEFLILLQNYLTKVVNENISNNIHSNNLKISLYNKKNHILIEYNKYCEQLTELIEYFLNCSKTIDKQLNNQELFTFLVNSKDT